MKTLGHYVWIGLLWSAIVLWRITVFIFMVALIAITMIMATFNK